MPVVKAKLGRKGKTIGNPGNRVTIRGFEDEYLGDLTYVTNSYDEYDKMRRSDYKVQQIRNAIRTPILSAKFGYSPKDPNDKKQVQQADFKNKVIGEWMDKPWQQNLIEILSYLDFGFATFEPTMKVIEDKEFGLVTTIRSLGFRMQKTIYEWKLDREGVLEAVRQFVPYGELQTDVWIPASELILFTNQQEGANYEGISMLRSAYGSWKRKQLYLKLDYIGIEKHSVGVPIAYVPQTILDDEEEKEQLESVLESYTSHEKQYILLPEAMKEGGLVVEFGQYDSEAVNRSIDREDMGILDSILASFLAIGTRSMGGNAQNKEQMDVFLNSLQFHGNYICNVLDPIVHQAYVMNYGEPEEKLTMTCTGINKRDLEMFAKIISTLIKVKAITADDPIEVQLRKELGLPDFELEDVDRTIQKPQNPKNDDEEDEGETDDKKKDTHDLSLDEKKFGRKLTEAEMNVNFNDLQKDFDKAEKNYKGMIRGYLDKMKSKYLADLRTALKQSNREKAIQSINIGFVGQLRTGIKEFMWQRVDTGAKQAADELNIERKKLAADDGKVKRVGTKINFNAKVIAGDVASGFENNSTVFVMGLLDDGYTDDELINETSDQIDEYIGSRTPYNSTGAVVNTYLNTGRNNFFFGNKDAYQGLQYSAILDDVTTDLCRSLDGQTFSPTDVDSFGLRPPNHWNCRSILVAVLPGMTKPANKGLRVRPVGGKSVRDILKQKQFEDVHSSCSCVY